MNFDDCLKIFLAICAGIGALKVIINSVKNCIKQEMGTVIQRLDHLEKDGLVLSEIEKKVMGRDALQDMIDKAILQHQHKCPKK